MFFRDDYEYKWDEDITNPQLQMVKAKQNPTSRDSWKFFLQSSFYTTGFSTDNLHGFSTAFINPEMSKNTDEIYDPKIALQSYSYYSGFTP